MVAGEPQPRGGVEGGEYEITDAVQLLVDEGVPVAVVRSAEGVWDLSSRTDVRTVAEALAGEEVAL
ncbi:hypothetical protein [Propioniciclava sp.]|uniref:hypothetical protein n=1 Tax=Propioniciclava sp. TaxID=2038686 RepID=UPI002601BC9D|nr:hypothetical protein [Propioniciclava sp.]